METQGWSPCQSGHRELKVFLTEFNRILSPELGYNDCIGDGLELKAELLM